MELNSFPVIDWELGVKLAGNKKQLAEEMLDLIIKDIPQEVSAIKQFYANQNYQELLRQVHKFHGALCYCGLPRLKSVVAQIEIELKNNMTMHLPGLLNQFEIEVNLLLEQYPAKSA